MPRLVPIGAAALLCACASAPSLPPAPAPAPPPPTADRGGFVVRLGNDTLAAEQFTRTADSLSGNAVVRSPATIVRSYSAALRPDGLVSRFELTARRAALTAPPQRVTMTFAGDSVSVSTQVGDSAARTTRLTTTGATLPYVGNVFAIFELATRYARHAGRPAPGGAGDTVRLSVVTAGRLFPATVTPVGADSMLVSIAGDAPYRARVDSAGRILGLQGTPTQQVSVTRVGTIDLQPLSANRPVGTLSPTDTVRGQIGAAALTVVYSRPSTRGRTILGGLVPYDQVWRTGANAATMFTTSSDITVGGTRVPRGSYTLWTLPSRSGWKLIINRQTGQWGTEYDPARDLARVDMASSPAAQPTEQFTIAVDTTGGNRGQLRMLWGDFELRVPVVAR